MAKNSRQARTGVEALQAKVAALQEKLGAADNAIAELESQRDADLRDYITAVARAGANYEACASAQQAALRDVESTEQKGRALIASGEKLLEEARRARERAENMNLGMPALTAAEIALAQRRSYWKERLADRQTGAIRRQRSQLKRALDKLQRRLTQRAAEPAPTKGVVPVLPKDRGTSEPTPSEHMKASK